MSVDAKRAGAADFDWYHTIDLGDGVVTAGLYDHRPLVPAYGLPDDLDGQVGTRRRACSRLLRLRARSPRRRPGRHRRAAPLERARRQPAAAGPVRGGRLRQHHPRLPPRCAGVRDRGAVIARRATVRQRLRPLTRDDRPVRPRVLREHAAPRQRPAPSAVRDPQRHPGVGHHRHGHPPGPLRAPAARDLRRSGSQPGVLDPEHAGAGGRGASPPASPGASRAPPSGCGAATGSSGTCTASCGPGCGSARASRSSPGGAAERSAEDNGSDGS